MFFIYNPSVYGSVEVPDLSIVLENLHKYTLFSCITILSDNNSILYDISFKIIFNTTYSIFYFSLKFLIKEKTIQNKGQISYHFIIQG